MRAPWKRTLRGGVWVQVRRSVRFQPRRKDVINGFWISLQLICWWNQQQRQRQHRQSTNTNKAPTTPLTPTTPTTDHWHVADLGLALDLALDLDLEHFCARGRGNIRHPAGQFATLHFPISPFPFHFSFPWSDVKVNKPKPQAPGIRCGPHKFEY